MNSSSSETSNAKQPFDPRKLEAEICRRSLSEFSRSAWEVLEPTTPLEWNWHLDALCDHIQALLEDWMAVMRARASDLPDPQQRMQNLAINVPPGTGKSRFVSVFTPAWMWLNWPSWRAIFVSGNPRVSLRDADYCRLLIESDWYRDTFRPDWALAKDQNAKSLYRNTAGGFRMAISAGSRITGDRGDGLFIDDPNDAEEVRSDAYRNGVNGWYDQGAGNRVNDLRTSVRALIMQRLHEADLCGHVLKTGQWECLLIPQEFEPGRSKTTAIGWRDPRANDGDLMFPTRFPASVLANEKARLGPGGYAGQHQQSPTPAGGGRFRQEWFRYFDEDAEFYRLYNHDGTLREAVPKLLCDTFAFMDPAGAEKNQNNKPCYTAMPAFAVTPGGAMLVTDVYRAQASVPDTADAAVAFVRKYDLPWVGVESDGIGLGTVQVIRSRGVTVKAVKARGSKEARSETAEIRMSAGMIYFRKGAPWLFEWEKELLLFPNGEYLDQVDALSHAARHVNRMKGAPETPDDAAHAATLPAREAAREAIQAARVQAEAERDAPDVDAEAKPPNPESCDPWIAEWLKTAKSA